jgi:hypothetical protein
MCHLYVNCQAQSGFYNSIDNVFCVLISDPVLFPNTQGSIKFHANLHSPVSGQEIAVSRTVVFGQYQHQTVEVEAGQARPILKL